MPSPCPRPLLIGLLLVSTAPLAAVTGSWTSLGPEGGAVWALASPASNPQVVYAGVFGGAYKSVDGGATWSWAGRGLNVQSVVTTLVIDPLHPSTLYAGQNPGLFKSVDGGSTWRQTGLPPYLAVSKIAIDSRSPQILFAATNGGLYQSSNGGGNWKRLSRGLVSPPYISVAVVIDPSSPRRMFATLQPKTPEAPSLFKSLDGGYSWQPVQSDLLKDEFVGLLPINPQFPKTLYVATTHGILRSTNDGRTWTRGNFPDFASVSGLDFHPTQKNILYAGGGGGVFRSVDGGATWTSLSQDLPPGVFITSILVSATKTPALIVG
ncbi:MAG TPA: hypothetical protein VLX28_02490, partial [Thermoanaerobaculia bacterium]|nr:hypothetical protein [Thermoanaerobaculia bacterium]